MSKPVCEHYENPCCRKSYDSEPSYYKKSSCCEPICCKKSSCCESSCCESSCCESNFFKKSSRCEFDCCRPNCCGCTIISPLTSLLVGPGPLTTGG